MNQQKQCVRVCSHKKRYSALSYSRAAAAAVPVTTHFGISINPVSVVVIVLHILLFLITGGHSIPNDSTLQSRQTQLKGQISV